MTKTILFSLLSFSLSAMAIGGAKTVCKNPPNSLNFDDEKLVIFSLPNTIELTRGKDVSVEVLEHSVISSSVNCKQTFILAVDKVRVSKLDGSALPLPDGEKLEADGTLLSKVICQTVIPGPGCN